MLSNEIECATISHNIKEKEERKVGNKIELTSRNRLNIKLLLIFIFYYNMLILLLAATILQTCPYNITVSNNNTL